MNLYRCLIDYGSCSLFSLHDLQTQTLKKIFLHSEVEINGQNSDDQTDVSDDFILEITTVQWRQISHPLRMSDLLK